jgi:hypothetical protein
MNLLPLVVSCPNHLRVAFIICRILQVQALDETLVSLTMNDELPGFRCMDSMSEAAR